MVRQGRTRPMEDTVGMPIEDTEGTLVGGTVGMPAEVIQGVLTPVEGTATMAGESRAVVTGAINDGDAGIADSAQTRMPKDKDKGDLGTLSSLRQSILSAIQVGLLE